jgi:hypothetical protein
LVGGYYGRVLFRFTTSTDLLLSLDEAFRVLEALEDSLLAMEESDLAPGLRDEVATVIRIVHVRLGLDEGGAR